MDQQGPFSTVALKARLSTNPATDSHKYVALPPRSLTWGPAEVGKSCLLTTDRASNCTGACSWLGSATACFFSLYPPGSLFKQADTTRLVQEAAEVVAAGPLEKSPGGSPRERPVYWVSVRGGGKDLHALWFHEPLLHRVWVAVY